jgi:hypothetical protein
LSNIKVRWLDPQPGYRLITRTLTIDLFGPVSAVEALREQDVFAEIKTGRLTDTTVVAQPQVRIRENPNNQIEIEKIAPTEIKLKRNK